MVVCWCVSLVVRWCVVASVCFVVLVCSREGVSFAWCTCVVVLCALACGQLGSLVRWMCFVGVLVLSCVSEVRFGLVEIR